MGPQSVKNLRNTRKTTFQNLECDFAGSGGEGTRRKTKGLSKYAPGPGSHVYRIYIYKKNKYIVILIRTSGSRAQRG